MAAGLKQLKSHIKSISNIQKVTASMKMVAAARFIQAEKYLTSARAMGEGTKQFYKHVTVDFDIAIEKLHYLIPVTSDRGLCGSCHLKVCKRAKHFLKEEKGIYTFFCLGEKSRSIIAFDHAHLLCYVVNGIGHKIPTFLTASKISIVLLSLRDFHQGTLVFPKFINMLRFEVSIHPLFSWLVLMTAEKLNNYEIEDDADFQSYIEFSITALIYYALCEEYLVELSARINAMSGAAKNAGKLTKQLLLQYNRVRQNLVTKELMDIIGGASVVVKKKK